MLRIGEGCYRHQALIEPDLYNDEIPVSYDTLCRWADRRFAKANLPRSSRTNGYIRSKNGMWVAVYGK